jgi:hypothetical protein
MGTRGRVVIKGLESMSEWVIIKTGLDELRGHFEGGEVTSGNCPGVTREQFRLHTYPLSPNIETKPSQLKLSQGNSNTNSGKETSVWKNYNFFIILIN